MANKIKKANIGAKVSTYEQLDNLVLDKKSVIWNGNRVPATIIIHQQYIYVRQLIKNKSLNIYLKNK